MSEEGDTVIWRVAIATGVAMGVILVLGGLRLELEARPEVGAKVEAKQEAGKASPTLRFARQGGVSLGELGEQLRILDPSPLFLPSALSGTQVNLPAQSELRMPEFSDSEGMPQRFNPDDLLAQTYRRGAVEDPRGLLRAGEAAEDLRGLTRGDRRVEALPERKAAFVIRRARDGEALGRYVLLEDEQIGQDLVDWSPMGLIMGVDAQGLMGVATVVFSSGNELVDKSIAARLDRIYFFGNELQNGAYRIEVGP